MFRAADPTFAVKVSHNTKVHRVDQAYFTKTNIVEFARQVDELFNGELQLQPGNCAFHYQDTDGDEITVTTTPELQEAFRQHTLRTESVLPPLRFTIATLTRSLTAVPQPTPTPTPAAAPVPPPRELTPVEKAQKVADFHGLEVHADEWHSSTFNALAMKLFENNVEGATIVLQQGVKAFPADQILWYNLACAHSVANEILDGVAALSQALECGYTHFDRIREDADLQNLRSSPLMQSLYQMAAPAPAAAAAPEPTSETSTASSPSECEEVASLSQDSLASEASIASVSEDSVCVEEVPAETPQREEAEKTPVIAPYEFAEQLEMMSGMGIQAGVARELLDKHNGNLEAAISAFFDY